MPWSPGGLVAALMVVTQSGWMIAVGVQYNHVLDHGFSPALATTVRALPTGWGIAAVEEAGRGHWWAVAGLLLALAGLIGLLFEAWARMLAPAVGNLYAQDGTALWLTLLTGSQKADVRGRHLAYLLIYGPIAAAVAIAGVLVSGLGWAWPYVAALVPALLGGGAGIFVLSAVIALAPGPDADKRPDNPLDRADTTAQSNVLFWLAIVPALPALAAVTLFGWAGVPVGVVTGIAFGWGLGALAGRRLEQHGPDLLLAEVGDAGELVAAVEVHEPDLVVVDIRLPPTCVDTAAPDRRLAFRTDRPGARGAAAHGRGAQQLGDRPSTGGE